MTNRQLEIMKTIISLLKQVQRENMALLIEYLYAIDFFNARSNDDNCKLMNFAGSLALHSLSVYYILIKCNSMFSLNLPYDSIIITSLLHDICRADKNDFPVGHSEKSIYIIQNFINLTKDEIMAINSHMGMCDIRSSSYEEFQRAYDISKLSLFLYISDMLSASLIENRYDISTIDLNNLFQTIK